jgi:hypothetical protein
MSSSFRDCVDLLKAYRLYYYFAFSHTLGLTEKTKPLKT